MWDAVVEHRSTLVASGSLHTLRSRQREQWLWSEIRDGLLDRFLDRFGPVVDAAVAEVRGGDVLPTVAAAELLERTD